MKRQTIRREVYFTVLVIEMHIPVTSVDVLGHEVRQWTMSNSGIGRCHVARQQNDKD